MKFHVSVSSPCLFYTSNKLLYSILSVSCLFFCELYVNNSGSHKNTLANFSFHDYMHVVNSVNYMDYGY